MDRCRRGTPPVSFLAVVDRHRQGSLAKQSLYGTGIGAEIGECLSGGVPKTMKAQADADLFLSF